MVFVPLETQALAYRDKAEISCYSLQISLAVTQTQK